MNVTVKSESILNLQQKHYNITVCEILRLDTICNLTSRLLQRCVRFLIVLQKRNIPHKA